MKRLVRRLNDKKIVQRVKRTVPVGPIWDRKGEKNPNWKSGTRKLGAYVRTYSPGHPKAVLYGKTPYVLRATLNLEKKIGRQLKKNELPHHSDHIKLNDSSKNLKLMTHSDHRREHSQGLSNQQRSTIAKDAVKRTQQFEKDSKI